MKRSSGTLICMFFWWLWCSALQAGSIELTQAEIDAILVFGPWPPISEPDPSNRVSGNPNAVALGREIFFSSKFSKDGNTSCATCHVPEYGFTERKPRAQLKARMDRNTQSLLNVRFQRWFSWDGSNDNLWAQSFAPLMKSNEMDLGARQLRQTIDNAAFKARYSILFGQPEPQASQLMFVNLGKALAAYIETLNTGKAPFDHFRDALQNKDSIEIEKYPLDAKRGLRIFLGKGNCSFCHSGPLFSNGEFHDAGVPYFVEAGRVDEGRHVGLKNLRSSPFTLAGDYSDDPKKSGAWKSLRVRKQHSDFGSFRVPSLRNVERTAPYMHDGRFSSLRNVIDHYSNIDLERMHADGELVLKPLNLSEQETADLHAFLKTLTAPNPEY